MSVHSTAREIQLRQREAYTRTWPGRFEVWKMWEEMATEAYKRMLDGIDPVMSQRIMDGEFDAPPPKPAAPAVPATPIQHEDITLQGWQERIAKAWGIFRID